MIATAPQYHLMHLSQSLLKVFEKELGEHAPKGVSIELEDGTATVTLQYEKEQMGDPKNVRAIIDALMQNKKLMHHLPKIWDMDEQDATIRTTIDNTSIRALKALVNRLSMRSNWELGM